MESAFRKQVADDNINVFLNLEEFAEYHEIEGAKVRCIVDDDVFGKAPGLKEHEAKAYGVTDVTFTLYVRAWEVERLQSGDQLEFDDQIYTVVDWRTDEGMHRITLRKPAAY